MGGIREGRDPGGGECDPGESGPGEGEGGVGREGCSIRRAWKSMCVATGDTVPPRTPDLATPMWKRFPIMLGAVSDQGRPTPDLRRPEGQVWANKIRSCICHASGQWTNSSHPILKISMETRVHSVLSVFKALYVIVSIEPLIHLMRHRIYLSSIYSNKLIWQWKTRRNSPTIGHVSSDGEGLGLGFRMRLEETTNEKPPGLSHAQCAVPLPLSPLKRDYPPPHSIFSHTRRGGGGFPLKTMEGPS